MQHMNSCVCIVCNPSFETGYHLIQVSPGLLIPLPLFSTVLLEVPRVLLSPALDSCLWSNDKDELWMNVEGNSGKKFT